METLRKIAKVVLLAVGTIIIFIILLIALFDNTPDKWYAIIPFLFIGVPILLVGLKMKTKIETKSVAKTSFSQNASNKTTMTTTIDKSALTDIYVKSQKEKQTKIKNYHYLKENIIGKVYQALESIEIIETTKNIDTLESRYNFLQQLFQELKIASYTPRYANDVQTALDQYKQMYYDKTPTKTQLVGLLKPIEFDMDTFYCSSIYNCFIRHYETQINEISLLKTEKGKKGRYGKLYESVLKSKELIYNECLSSINFDELYQSLEQYENELESKM